MTNSIFCLIRRLALRLAANEEMANAQDATTTPTKTELAITIEMVVSRNVT
jgi:hypothetical protein